MNVASSGPAATRDPGLREEDGGLSLHFEDGTVQSRMIYADPARLVLEYTRLMMGFLLFQPAPARIAMIGLGGGSLAKYCALKLPEADFTAIEISPEVIGLREAFGVPPDGPRFRIVCEDGAAFVRSDGEPLDVLLVDGFDRGGQSEQLCSAAFCDYCRDRLAAGGVLVVNLYSSDAECDGRIDRHPGCVRRKGRCGRSGAQCEHGRLRRNGRVVSADVQPARGTPASIPSIPSRVPRRDPSKDTEARRASPVVPAATPAGRALSPAQEPRRARCPTWSTML